MREIVFNIIQEILEAKGGVSLSEIDTNTSLREDLDFNSFDLAELTVKIEDAFDIDIYDDGLVTTVGEIFAKLEKK